MNLVFHAFIFVLKVGVCFLIGAKFSELCLWFLVGLVGDKMLVSFIMYVYWSARFFKCIYKKCMHRATWSVQLVALIMAQEFQTHTIFELFCMHSAEKILARDKKHKMKGCHLIPLVYSCYCNLCVCVWERERESQWKQSAGRTASTTQTSAKYSINTAKVCVCLLTFFCLLSAEKLLTGDEKHRKKHVVSSLWYTEALQFVRVHACITLKRKCRTNSKHDTKPVSISQRKIQRQRCMCHNEKT